MKRTLLGAAFFLILVGEPTVGLASGLFTPFGITVFALLYISYFLLFDSLVFRYRLTNLQMVFMNFALYSVLITGFFHGELRDYVLHPQNNLITTLIRIQSSLFPLYAYPLLARLAPRSKPRFGPRASLVVFAVTIIFLSQGQVFGLAVMQDTLNVAPAASLGFLIAMGLALLAALRPTRTANGSRRADRLAGQWAWAFLIIGSVPSLGFFLGLLVAMTGVSGYLLSDRAYRQAGPAQVEPSGA
jgi:hypothetical protein